MLVRTTAFTRCTLHSSHVTRHTSHATSTSGADAHVVWSQSRSPHGSGFSRAASAAVAEKRKRRSWSACGGCGGIITPGRGRGLGALALTRGVNCIGVSYFNLALTRGGGGPCVSRLRDFVQDLLAPAHNITSERAASAGGSCRAPACRLPRCSVRADARLRYKRLHDGFGGGGLSRCRRVPKKGQCAAGRGGGGGGG